MTHPPQAPQRELLTPKQAAEEFGVHASTLWQWANDGMLPYQRTLGGHRRYRRTDIERLLGRAS